MTEPDQLLAAFLAVVNASREYANADSDPPPLYALGDWIARVRGVSPAEIAERLYDLQMERETND